MHDVLGVHHFQTLQNAFHNHFDLVGCKFMTIFDFIAELTSFQQLHAHVY